MPTIRVPLGKLQANFVGVVLPRVQAHARVYFRHVRCPERRAEAAQEMVALAWLWHMRLARQGKDASRFPTALAGFAARAVSSGRRLCGQDRARDVLSPRGQRLKGFAVAPLPCHSTLAGGPLQEALADNTRTPPDEQACFRLDFPSWLAALPRRDRRMALDMAAGERTTDLARKYRVSAARVSQKRREFFHGWQAFGADPLDLEEFACRS